MEDKTPAWKRNYEKNKDAHHAARQKYAKDHEKFISVRLNKINDWDIVAKLDSETNKMGYIKRLIRDDIKRTGFNPGPRPTKPGAPPDPKTLPPVEPVPTVDMDVWRRENPELVPPVEPVPTELTDDDKKMLGLM